MGHLLHGTGPSGMFPTGSAARASQRGEPRYGGCTLKGMVFVHQLMTPAPLCLHARMTAANAVKKLLDHRIHGAPVVDESGRLLGVASLVDLAGAQDREKKASVGELMSEPAVTIDPGATVYEAARLLVDRGIQRLIIVGDDGRPIGVLTASDLLRGAVNLGDAFRFREDETGRTP